MSRGSALSLRNLSYAEGCSAAPQGIDIFNALWNSASAAKGRPNLAQRPIRLRLSLAVADIHDRMLMMRARYLGDHPRLQRGIDEAVRALLSLLLVGLVTIGLVILDHFHP